MEMTDRGTAEQMQGKVCRTINKESIGVQVSAAGAPALGLEARAQPNGPFPQMVLASLAFTPQAAARGELESAHLLMLFPPFKSCKCVLWFP
jgi:hypothetical protein